MVGNPDFHSKQLKIIIKFPLQNVAEKPQGFLLCWYLQVLKSRLRSFSLCVKQHTELCCVTSETDAHSQSPSAQTYTRGPRNLYFLAKNPSEYTFDHITDPGARAVAGYVYDGHGARATQPLFPGHSEQQHAASYLLSDVR